MRPVERGANPLDDNGDPKIYLAYTQARRDLIDRMGQYCSYCETELGASLAVEHVQPKNLVPELMLVWDNFLLACTNCNSTKLNKPVILNQYFWPDKDNTFRAFVYSAGGIVQVDPTLTAAEQERAQRMIDLVGLDKIPGNNPAASDRRWENRREAWEMAQRGLGYIEELPVETMRNAVVEIAVAKGFWSVWMTVFTDDPIMRRLLIEAFAGTSVNCFDLDTVPVSRPNGDL